VKSRGHPPQQDRRFLARIRHQEMANPPVGRLVDHRCLKVGMVVVHELAVYVDVYDSQVLFGYQIVLM
jgi:hypothetical protein